MSESHAAGSRVESAHQLDNECIMNTSVHAPTNAELQSPAHCTSQFHALASESDDEPTCGHKMGGKIPVDQLESKSKVTMAKGQRTRHRADLAKIAKQASNSLSKPLRTEPPKSNLDNVVVQIAERTGKVRGLEGSSRATCSCPCRVVEPFDETRIRRQLKCDVLISV